MPRRIKLVCNIFLKLKISVPTFESTLIILHFVNLINFRRFCVNLFNSIGLEIAMIVDVIAIQNQKMKIKF